MDRDIARGDRATVAAVVLAAGRSRRMGADNKLLARLQGRPLIARVAARVLASRARPVVVVTGHDAGAVTSALSGLEPLRVVHNPDHRDGLSTSLRHGLRALPAAVTGALVCLGDMPWVTTSVLDSLISAFERDAARPICVPGVAGRRGNPVLWPARHFEALARVTGDRGGRDLLREFLDQVVEVEVADDGVLRDVDTPDDLRRSGGRESSSSSDVE